MSNTFIQILEAFPEKKWCWTDVSANPNVSLDYIESHKKNLPWVFSTEFINEGVSANPNLTMDYIKKNPHIKWNWQAVSSNPSQEKYIKMYKLYT